MQEKLDGNQEFCACVGGETKSKLVYMAVCALILHFFPVEQSPTSGMILIAVVNLRMVKGEPIRIQDFKSHVMGFFWGIQASDCGSDPTVDECHLLIGLKEEKVVSRVPQEDPREEGC